MGRKNIRAVAVVIKNRKLLAMYHQNGSMGYYALSGGGVEDDESVEEAVVREVMEETTVEVKIDKLLYEHHYPDNGDQYFYLCKYISGTPKLGDGPEKEKMEKGTDIYKPEWLEISKLENILLYPLEIRDWIIDDFENNFKDTPKTATLKTTKLRQRL